MTIPLRYATAGQEIPLGYFLDSTDGDTEETGLTIANTDIKLWKHGHTTLTDKNSGGATHISNGVYYCVLDATDSNTKGGLVVFVHKAGALSVKVNCFVYSENIYDTMCSTDVLKCDLWQIGGVEQSATDLKDFADEGYDPATNKVQGVVLTDTCTTSTTTTNLTNAATNGDLTATMKTSVNTEADTALTDYDPPTKTEMDSAFTEIKGATWAAGTDTLEHIRNKQTDIETDTAEIGVAGAGLTDLGGMSTGMKAEVESEANDALVAQKLDHLVAVADADDVVDNSIIAKLASNGATADWSTFVNTTDALEAIRDRGDAAWTTGAGGSPPTTLQNTTIATLASQTSFTLTAGSTDDHAYKGAIIVVEDSVTATQKAVGRISAYTGATKTVTLQEDPGVFSMAVGDTVDVIADDKMFIDYTTAKAAFLDHSIATVDGVCDGIQTDLSNATDGLGALKALIDTVQTDLDNPDQYKATGFAPANEYDTQMGYIPSNLGDVPTAAELNSAHGAGSWATATGFSTHNAAAIWSVAARILTANTNFNDLDAAAIKAEVAAALQDIKLDHLLNIAVDTDWATTVHLDSVIGHMADVGTSATFNRTTDALEAIRNRGDSAWVTATGFNTTTPPTVIQIRQEMDSNSTKMAPSQVLAEYKATGFSTHSATNVWSVGTRALTDKSGFALSTAGIKAIWDQLTAALTTVDSIGKLLVDNINATISSRNSTTPPTVGAIRTEMEGPGTKLTEILEDTGTTLDEMIERILGLEQENLFIDNTTYTGVHLTSARIRIYSVAGSVGTASDVIATYTMTASYTGDEMDDYKVVKV